MQTVLLKELLGKYFWLYYMDLEINWRELQVCLSSSGKGFIQLSNVFQCKYVQNSPFCQLSTLYTWLRAIKLKFDALAELGASCLT